MKVQVTTEPLLNDAETAVFLNVSRRTLADWRWRGQGPSYVKLGSGKRAPVRYVRSALEAFVNENLKLTA